MSIIGYDGRIRPVSRPLTVNAPNQFDPAAVEKIGNAQPKFGQMVADVLGSVGKDAQRYGAAVEQRDRRKAALDSQESVIAAKRDIENQRQAIMEDETLTAEQKREKAAALKRPEVKSVGREGIDRSAQMQIDEALYSAGRSIEADAHRMEVAAANAEFGAKTATLDAEIDTEYLTKEAEFLSEKDPVAAGKKLKEWYKARVEAAKEGMNLTPAQAAQFNAMSARKEAALLVAIGRAHNARTKQSMMQNHATIIAGITESADISTKDALAATRVIFDDPEVSQHYTPVEARNIVNSVAITRSQNAIQSAKTAVDTVVNAGMEEANELLINGNTKGYNAKMTEIDQSIVGIYDALRAEVNANHEALLESVKNDDTLTDELKESYVAVLNKQREDMLLEINKEQTSRSASTKYKGEAARTKAGTSACRDVKAIISKTATGETSALANECIVLLSGGGELAKKQRAATEQQNANIAKAKEEGTFDEKKDYRVDGAHDSELAQKVANVRYPGRSEADSMQRLIDDFIYEIIDLDFDENGNQDILGLNEILKRAGEVFGFGHETYNYIAAFAEANLRRQKNRDAGKVGDWLIEELRGSTDRNQWMADLTTNQKQLLNHLDLRLQEVPEDDVPRMIESCANLFYSSGAYEKVLGFDDVANSIERAKSSKGSATNKGFDALAAEQLKKARGESTVEQDKAELAALESNTSTTGVRWKARQEFYKKKIEDEFGDLESLDKGRFNKLKDIRDKRYSAYETSYEGVYNTLVLERGERLREMGSSEQRLELEKKLKEAGLPLNRNAYNSTLGMGGFDEYEGFDGDEIELGVNWSGREELTLAEMQEVLNQYSRIKANRERPRVDVLRERLKSADKK